MNDALVSTEFLAAHKGDIGLKIVDATFKMPGVLPTAADSYRAAHIPGAAFFDIDGISDHTSPLPHMLPSPDEFARHVAALGLGDTDRIVIYDSAGLVGATRAWWSFRVFGHENVSVLDGGLTRWQMEQRPVDALVPVPTAAKFTSRYNPALVRTVNEIVANLDTRAEQILDARAAPRFEGIIPEPRAGLRQGHIPGSYNLDHVRLVNKMDTSLKSVSELKALFNETEIDLSRPIVTSCGSGVSATVLAFALYLLGYDGVAVYDGSWTEWGLLTELPIETGPR